MQPMRFLFVSADTALIGDVAWHVHEAGHDVKYYVGAEGDREIADGFVPKTDDWRADLDWADVVVFDDIWVARDDQREATGPNERGDAPRAGDSVGTGDLAAELRADGHAVVGGTPNTDRLEEDRGYAMAVLEANGVNTIDHEEFTDFQAGIQHVRENRGRTSCSPSAKSRTSSDCCTSATRTTAAMSSTSCAPTRRRRATA